MLPSLKGQTEWQYEVLLKDGRRLIKNVVAVSAWYGLLRAREMFPDAAEVFTRGPAHQNGRPIYRGREVA